MSNEKIQGIVSDVGGSSGMIVYGDDLTILFFVEDHISEELQAGDRVEFNLDFTTSTYPSRNIAINVRKVVVEENSV